MEKTEKSVLEKKISEITGKESWFKVGNFRGYSASFDRYDSGKLEVSFDNFPIILSVIYEMGDNFLLLHIDDFTGAYYKIYPADLVGITLLEAAYKTFINLISKDFVSIHDFVEFLEEQGFEYSRY